LTCGLSGAHRTGKTTLAKAVAGKMGLTFIETSTSAIFKELGLDPAATFDFAERLRIQDIILDRTVKQYAAHAGTASITDRTPLDMLAYTMSEALGTMRPEDEEAFDSYTTRCFEATNNWFSTICVIQPGIPLVAAPGKAAMSRGYMEHLNSLILGFSADPRLTAPHFYVPRRNLALEDRVECVKFCIDRSLEMAMPRRNAAGYATVSLH